MTSLKFVLIASWVTALGVLWSQHSTQMDRDAEVARLRDENARIRAAIAERTAAHSVASASVPSAADDAVRPPPAVGVSVAKGQPSAVDQPKRWPIRRYTNAGQSTPTAALQTMAWACDQGDVETMAGLFLIDEDVRPQANAIYEAIPAKQKAEWSSVEAFAAAIIVHNGIEQPYPGAEVLALAKIEHITESRVMLLLPGAVVSGVVFQQTAGGWKYVIREAVVAEYIARHLTPATVR